MGSDETVLRLPWDCSRGEVWGPWCAEAKLALLSCENASVLQNNKKTHIHSLTVKEKNV